MSRTERDADEHLRQMLENRHHWDAKPALREVYREFYALIASSLSFVPGETVEVGSGIGKIHESIPDCIRTDFCKTPWIDRQENIYRFSMNDNSVANLILFDVFHHLEYPLAAMRECRRVLAPGGRLLVFDHAMSAAGLVVSGLLHHERRGFARPYSLSTDLPCDLDSQAYYADQANAHRILARRFNELLGSDWRRMRVVRLPALKWLLSGGYRGRSLLDVVPRSLLATFEAGTKLLPWMFSLRQFVVLEKK